MCECGGLGEESGLSSSAMVGWAAGESVRPLLGVTPSGAEEEEWLDLRDEQRGRGGRTTGAVSGRTLLR